MRVAPLAIGVAAIGLATAVAWHFRPASRATGEPENVAERAPSDTAVNAPAPAAGADAASDSAPRAVDPADAVAGAPTPAPSPLPGEVGVTPMAQLLEGKQQQFPPELVQGERDFAAEPVDATWAPGTEADILARFAQMPGLALTGLRVECRSTMCRLQLVLPKTQGAVSPPFDTGTLGSSLGLEPRWVMLLVDDSGTPQSVTYLGRQGVAPKGAP